MPAVVDEVAGKADELVVLLPGRWSLPREFVDEGFLELVRQRHPRARIVAPDLHLGYYRERSAIERLHRDVVLPAREDGIDRVTLVGISMGGLGALLYDLEHPGVADRLVLLSPFAGEAEVIEEVADAGGVAKWEPGEIAADDFSRRLWSGLKREWSARERPRVELGCGRGDRLAPTSRQLAADFLEPGDAVWLPGGHDWPTWRALYRGLRVPDGP